MVSFLCSDAAAYVTGTWLPVDGGIGLSGLTLGRERGERGERVIEVSHPYGG